MEKTAEKKQQMLTVMMSKKEHMSLKLYCVKHNVGMSDFVREAIAEKLSREGK